MSQDPSDIPETQWRITQEIQKRDYTVIPFENIKNNNKSRSDEYLCNYCDYGPTTDFPALVNHIQSGCEDQRLHLKNMHDTDSFESSAAIREKAKHYQGAKCPQLSNPNLDTVVVEKVDETTCLNCLKNIRKEKK